MFTLDSDLVGLQQHIQEFNPIFRQAFKTYMQGDWELAAENIERCLELWDTDGPTKALQYYMSFYKYQAPTSWNGYRDIDEPIDLDKINQEHNLGDNGDGAVEEEPDEANEKPDGAKAKKSTGEGKKSRSEAVKS